MGACLEEWFDLAFHLAKESGKMIKEASLKEKKVDTKLSFADLVTESDREIESYIMGEVARRYPHHKYIGEEMSCFPGWSDDPTWIVDPIDGTTNFVHSFPFCCVSIGITYKRQSVVGVVFAPHLDLMFTAVKDKGAFCNGERIHASSVKQLKESLVTCEVGSFKTQEIVAKKIENYHTIALACHGIRSLGSCALNMCMIASGQSDASYEFGVHCWDMAAACLILTESGASIQHPTGRDFDVMDRSYIAASCYELLVEVKEKLTLITYERDDA